MPDSDEPSTNHDEESAAAATTDAPAADE